MLFALVPRLLDPQTRHREMAEVRRTTKNACCTALFRAWVMRLLTALPNVSATSGAPAIGPALRRGN